MCRCLLLRGLRILTHTFIVVYQLDNCGKGSLGTDVAATVVHLTNAVVLDDDVILARVEVSY